MLELRFKTWRTFWKANRSHPRREQVLAADGAWSPLEMAHFSVAEADLSTLAQPRGDRLLLGTPGREDLRDGSAV